MSFAGKNLRFLRKQIGWTQDEFAERLNIKRSLVGAYEEERAEPRLDVLKVICEIYKLSFEELLLKDLSLQSIAENKDYLSERRKKKLDTISVNSIIFVPVKAAAGYMSGYADPNFLDELNTFTLPMLGAGQFRAFEIIGDSMLPTPSGSVVVGEKLEKADDIKNSNTYILLSKSDGIVYKRVIKNKEQKNKLTLMSDNPDYDPYLVNEQEVLEIWKAVYIIQKAQSKHLWDVNHLAGMVTNLQDQVSNLQKKLA